MHTTTARELQLPKQQLSLYYGQDLRDILPFIILTIVKAINYNNNYLLATSVHAIVYLFKIK